MAKQSLKSIHRLISIAVEETPVEKQFLQDLRVSIEKMDAREARKPSQSYKPSSLNCIRNMYFQVTGAATEDDRANSCLVGICESGTDRHERLQAAVSSMKEFGIDCEYVDVGEYVKTHNLPDIEVIKKSGFETKLFNKKLNMSFLCDGIIKYKGEYFILEIKTESIYKWQNRTDVADEHRNQATCYSMNLGINKVLFVYECRDNCEKKAYILCVTDDMKFEVLSKIELCDGYVSNLTPPPMPTNVTKKTCAYCKYKGLCKRTG